MSEDIVETSDSTKDQTGEASADPATNQETEQRTIEVLLVPTTDSERLLAVQAGGTPKGLRINIDPTAPGLTGITADGSAKWRSWKELMIALEAAVAGEDITAALEAYHDEQAAEEKVRKFREDCERTNRATVEAAGLSWYDVPYNMRDDEDPHAVVMAAKAVADRKAEDAAADEQLIADRNAELAAGLPDGYKPWCTAGNDSPYGVTAEGMLGEGMLLGHRRYDSPAKAIMAAHKHADEQAAKAAKAAEREAWITEHGSPGLKDRVARGYSCSRLYMEERLAAELPGWTLAKWDGRPDWELKSRACPSDTALILEDMAKAAGFEASTQWAVWDVRYDEYHEDEGEEAEVVVVDDFHGYVIYILPQYYS